MMPNTSVPVESREASETSAAALAPTRVVVLDPEGRHGAELAAVLDGGDAAARFRIERVQDLEAARLRLAAGEVDVTVLVLPSPGERGVLPLPELCAAAPQVPVVVLAESSSEPLAIKAVQLGAADYLLAGQLYATLVARCLLHAVESTRVRAQLAVRQLEWLPLVATERTTALAASLRLAMPEQFEALARTYRALLDRAVAHLDQRSATLQLEPAMRELAQRAGELRAGARDVVEIHAHAMESSRDEHGALRAKVYAAEGRVRLLELMGHLTNYYREVALAGQRSGSPASR